MSSLLFAWGLLPALALAAPTIDLAAARTAFAEANAICATDAGKLWGQSLCGPIMLVAPSDRSLVTNQADKGGVLKPAGGLFTGTLPPDQNSANTAVSWSGTSWTQLLWPLPAEPGARRTLLAHELFHRIQASVGIGGGNAANHHLDTQRGRVLLQLEWRALRKALASKDAARKQAVADALLFRQERHAAFPGSAEQEASLELQEGLAEYTGITLAYRTPAQREEAASHNLDEGPKRPTFVRSFAYASGPAYGVLLDATSLRWRPKIRDRLTDGLGGLAREGYKLPAPGAPSAERLAARSAVYDGAALEQAETTRERARAARLAKRRAQLVDGPVLRLPMQKPNVQFNPSELEALGDQGTVYPTLRASDAWGVLTVTDGALIGPDWKWMFVAAPKSAAGGTALEGEGWTLELKPGWSTVPAERKGDLKLQPPAADGGPMR